MLSRYCDLDKKKGDKLDVCIALLDEDRVFSDLRLQGMDVLVEVSKKALLSVS